MAVKKPSGPYVPQWVWGAYYGLSVLYILEGVYNIVMAFVHSHDKFMGEELGFGLFGYVSLILGGLSIALGLGLLFQIQSVRNVVNFFCGVQILFGILGLAGSAIGAVFSGPLGILLMFNQVLQIAAAAFMIYIIGETDKVAPNL